MPSPIEALRDAFGRVLADPASAPTLRAFLRAFRHRRDQPWRRESQAMLPDAGDGLAMAVAEALAAYRGGPLAPILRGSVQDDVYAPFRDVIERCLTGDAAASHFLAVAVCSDDGEALPRHLLAALHQYEIDERHERQRLPTRAEEEAA